MNELEQIKKEMEQGVYDFTKNGKCSCCGACCSNLLPMTKQEIKVIKKYIKEKNISEQKRIYPTENKIIDITCPFLDSTKEKKCLIYEVRPKICREFICHKTFDNKAEFGFNYIPVLVREEFYNHKFCI